MLNTLIQITNLNFHFGEKPIFQNLSLTIPRGKIIAVMGPSGTGKTTLLRLIAAQLQPSSGEIEFDGQKLYTLPRRQLFDVRKQMGLLFQSSALFTNLNVFDNVAFPLRENTRLSEKLIRMIVLMKLHIVGLRGAAYLSTNQLSGGMARRVALARALALDPQFMMYDEPFTGLDPISMGVIVKLIREVNQALGMTSIIVSHDVAEVCSIADYAYVIADGRLIGQGTPKQLQQDPSPTIQQFMQGLPDGAVPFHYPCARSYEEELFDA